MGAPNWKAETELWDQPPLVHIPQGCSESITSSLPLNILLYLHFIVYPFHTELVCFFLTLARYIPAVKLDFVLFFSIYFRVAGFLRYSRSVTAVGDKGEEGEFIRNDNLYSWANGLSFYFFIMRGGQRPVGVLSHTSEILWFHNAKYM